MPQWAAQPQEFSGDFPEKHSFSARREIKTARQGFTVTIETSDSKP